MTFRKEIAIAIETGFLTGDNVGVHVVEDRHETLVYTSLSEEPIQITDSFVDVPGSYGMKIKEGIRLDMAALIARRMATAHLN